MHPVFDDIYSPRSGNNRDVYQRRKRRDSDVEVLQQLMPDRDNSAIEAAQRTIAGDSKGRSNDSRRIYRPMEERAQADSARSFSSRVKEAGNGAAPESESFRRDKPRTIPSIVSEAAQGSSAGVHPHTSLSPATDLRHKDRLRTEHGVPRQSQSHSVLAEQHSSPDSPESGEREADYSVTPLGHEREVEVQTGQQYLSNDEGDGNQPTQRRHSPPTGGSATPPPIRRAHRYVDDEPEGVSTFGGGNMNSTSKPPIMTRLEENARPRAPSYHRRRSQGKDPSSTAQEANHRTTRTPALDRIKKFQDSEQQLQYVTSPRARDPTRRGTPKLDYGRDDREREPETGREDSMSGPIDLPSTERRPRGDQGHPMSSHRDSRQSDGSSRIADFFSPSIFQVVLHNPTTSHQLLKYSETQVCSENVEFLGKVEQYRTIVNSLAGTLAVIHRTFVSDQSPNQVNVPGGVMKTVHNEMKSLVTVTLPSMESLFNEMQNKIEQLVFEDIYPRFVRYQMALSTARALASDRQRYQGLGDCFCMTSPAKADNPILYASDGFVKVTGYSRSEIIPRNCRFLQGSQTDRRAAYRLKEAVRQDKEAVELLLNYTKSGNPFWNLLYIAPLFDDSGEVVFYIGGQVNCSTTVHTNVDVMRVLSMADEEPNMEDIKNQTKRSSGKSFKPKSLLKTLGIHVDEQEPPLPVPGETGMEQKVLDRMEGHDLRTQIREFYSAYSKYIIARADNFVIKFYSAGVTETLHPANQTGGPPVGQDIFRFFKQNMLAHQSDYKNRVRNAIQSGFPISVEIRLQTRRSAMFRGDESFMTHWTPLKDEGSVVHWVVVTFAPMMN
ncbi:hypothetical protein JX266_000366 [Neoarthrinium moseri]|nr:hypothetical protein JX266_000366 [Neoarthrinium moseri]